MANDASVKTLCKHYQAKQGTMSDPILLYLKYSQSTLNSMYVHHMNDIDEITLKTQKNLLIIPKNVDYRKISKDPKFKGCNFFNFIWDTLLRWGLKL